MKKRIKKIVTIIVILLILAAVVGVAVFIYKVRNRTYKAYTVKSSVEIKGNSNASMLVGDNSIIKMTRDGASAYNINGSEVWNVSYEMNAPVGDVCSDYTAIADVGGVTLYIIGKEGKITKIATDHAISMVRTSSLGSTAVWMDNGSKDYIAIYDASGNKAVDMMTAAAEDGLPVTMCLSDDGSKLVTSYAYFDNNQLRNKLTFYNFGEVGSNYVDRLVGLKKYEDRLVGDVKFCGDNRVVAFSDKGVSLFDMEEYEEEIKELAIDDHIEAVSASSDYFALFTSANGAYKATVFDINGKEVTVRNISRDYDRFYISGRDLVFFDDTELFVTRIKGKDKAVLDLGMDIKGVLTQSGGKTFMIMGEKAVNVIELVGESGGKSN